MVRRRVAIVAVAIVAVAIVVSMSSLCPAETTTTTQPAAAAATRSAAVFTEHDLVGARLRFNQRTMTRAYEKIGKRDPRWDDAAIKFLDAMALRYSNANEHRMYALPGMIALPEARKIGESAIDAGCDDPLVRYCYATVLYDSGQRDKAKEMLPAIVDELFQSRYPINRAANAVGRLYQWTDKTLQPAEANAIWMRFADAAQATLSTWNFSEDEDKLDRRFLFNALWDHVNDAPVQQRGWFCDQLKQNEKADPWLAKTIIGCYEVDAAWAARGAGWANTVAEDGWKRFFAHLRTARDLLNDAWQLHPEYPEAAQRMIAVAMGGEDLHEDARKWFDRAVAAQFDYMPAYSSLLWQLRPRWGGSHEAMYQFGVECANSGRYDTLVPWQLIVSIQDITQDLDNVPAFWQRPGVFEQVRDMLEHYAAADANYANVYRSWEAAVAWRVSRYPEARKLLDDLGGKTTDDGFRSFRVLPKLAISHAYAMSSDARATLEEAERDAALNHLDDAASAYRAVLAKLPKDDRGSMFVRGRARELSLQPRYMAGGWIDIQPDQDMSLWYPIVGDWTVDAQKRMMGRYDDGCIALFHAGFLGENYEFTGTVQFPPKLPTGKGGPIVLWQDEQANYTANLRLKEADVMLMRAGYRGDTQPASVAEKNTFRAVVKGNRLDLWVNDQQVMSDTEMPWAADRRRFVGCSVKSVPKGQGARFTDLKLRMLDPNGQPLKQP